MLKNDGIESLIVSRLCEDWKATRNKKFKIAREKCFGLFTRMATELRDLNYEQRQYIIDRLIELQVVAGRPDLTTEGEEDGD